MSGFNPAVVDVELLNPYQGIYAVGAGRHYIARVVCNISEKREKKMLKKRLKNYLFI
jgi:hypothetical protein